MKTNETKITHSQQPAKGDKAFFEQTEETAFFSDKAQEQPSFFQGGASPTIQAKSISGSHSFFQPSRVPTIQTKCADCEAEEQQQEEETQGGMPEVQRMAAFGSDDEGDEKNVVQRMPAFESDEASVQAKLTVGQPGDKYEQEADATADRVMAMPEPEMGGVERSPKPLSIQRFSPARSHELQQQPEATRVGDAQLPCCLQAAAEQHDRFGATLER